MINNGRSSDSLSSWIDIVWLLKLKFEYCYLITFKIFLSFKILESFVFQIVLFQLYIKIDKIKKETTKIIIKI